MSLLKSNNFKLNGIALVFSLSVIAIAFNNLLWFGIAAILFLIIWNMEFWAIEKKNYSIALVIIGFLLITSDLSEELRLGINIISLVILFYFFINIYGFKFSNYPRFPRSLSFFILLVISSMTLSSLFSINLYTGFTETFRQILFFIIIYFLYSFIDLEKDVYYFLGALFISAMILALIICFTFLNSNTLSYLLMTEGFVIDAGYMNNQAAAGGLLAVSTPITLSVLFCKNIVKPYLKKYVAILIFTQFTALLLTNSRAAIFASFISTAIILFLLRRKLFLFLIKLLTVFVGFIILIFPSTIEIVSGFFRLTRVLENTRYYIWEMAINIIKDHFSLGIGPGQFYNYMYNNLPVMLGTWEEKQLRWLYDVVGSGFGIAHNFLVQRFTELGILGLITGIYLPVMFLSYGIRLSRVNKGKDNYALIIAIVSAGIGLFFRSFYEATGLLSYGWITRDLPFWLLFLILIFYEKLNSTKINSSPNPLIKLIEK